MKEWDSEKWVLYNICLIIPKGINLLLDYSWEIYRCMSKWLLIGSKSILKYLVFTWKISWLTPVEPSKEPFLEYWDIENFQELLKYNLISMKTPKFLLHLPQPNLLLQMNWLKMSQEDMITRSKILNAC